MDEETEILILKSLQWLIDDRCYVPIKQEAVDMLLEISQKIKKKEFDRKMIKECDELRKEKIGVSQI